MPKIIEMKTLTQSYANAVSNLVRVLPEALPSGRGTWPAYQREAIAAHLEGANPGLALSVASMAADGRGGEAIDLLATAVSRLERDDQFLFAKPPTRDEAFEVACEWHAENPSPVGSHRRAYLWSNFADQMDAVRYANVYAQKHDITTRKPTAPCDFTQPARTASIRSPAIDGGALERGDNGEASDTFELPGRIGGVVSP